MAEPAPLATVSRPPTAPLVVGSEQDFPPFATGMTNATAGGFTVELWRAVAAEAGLASQIRVEPFHELLRDFQDGRIDVLINLAQSDERRAYADFTVPHVIVHGAIFAREGTTDIRSEADLDGKSILVINKDLAHRYAESQPWGRRLVHVDTAADGLKLLASGQHDVMLLSKLTGLETIRTAGLTGIEPLDVPAGFSQRFAFAVQKGNADLLMRLNEALAVTKSDGTYDALYDKWFGVYQAPVVGAAQVLTYVSPVVLAFVGALGFVFHRRRVERRRADADLRDSEYRWKFAVEGSGDGLWDWDVAAGTVLYSARWKEMLGFVGNEIGTAPSERETRIHPEDHEQVRAGIQAHLDGRSPLYVSEHRVRCKDGTWKWVLDRALVVTRDPAGKALRVIGTHSDISARKQAEDQKRLSAVIAASLDAMITVDEGERIVFFSAAAERLFLVPAAEAIGSSLDRFIPERHRAAHHGHFLEFAQGGVTSRPMGAGRRLMSLRSDGTEFPVEASIARIASGGGYLSTVTLRDITERERAQADLARTSELLRRTGELARVGGWELDLGSMTLFWSVETCRIHEVSPPVAPSLDAAIGFYAPEARPVIEGAVKAAIEQGTPWDLELPLITATGRPIWVRAQGAAVHENGKLTRLIGAFHDITERRRDADVLRTSEEQLRLAVRGGDLGLWDLDVASGRLGVNDRWSSILGLDAAGPAPTMAGWRARIHPDDLPMVDRTFAELTANRGVDEFQIEVRAHGADGRVVWILQRGAVVERSGDGAPVRIAGTHMDITARKHGEAVQASLEAQLRESQKMQAIGTLAGGIAHDFNNIIATILCNADLARSEPEPGESLTEIRKATMRARDLVQQILSFSRRQPTERRAIGPASAVEESSRLLRATMPPRLVLDVSCAPDLPLVMADATQIQQVVINLANNAMQAIPSGRGRIEIRLDSLILDPATAHPGCAAMVRTPPAPVVRLAVRDDGAGIDAATAERIFEPFFTTKAVDEGTGLGLSVALGIVQAHEGAITVESAPGQGSTFTVYLPCATTSELGTVVDAPQTAPEAPGSGSRRHIVVIDDDVGMVRAITRLMERRGYRVSGFTDQQAALALVRTDPADVDLVVTDYNMPGMSGLDVAREVRLLRADLTVAVASGFIDETLQANSAAAGVRELIFKATSVDDLCATLARLATPS